LTKSILHQKPCSVSPPFEDVFFKGYTTTAGTWISFTARLLSRTRLIRAGKQPAASSLSSVNTLAAALESLLQAVVAANVLGGQG
jgi:hypothetical protein